MKYYNPNSLLPGKHTHEFGDKILFFLRYRAIFLFVFFHPWSRQVMKSGLRALGGRLWMFMRSRLSKRMGIVETRRVFQWLERVIWASFVALYPAPSSTWSTILRNWEENGKWSVYRLHLGSLLVKRRKEQKDLNTFFCLFCLRLGEIQGHFSPEVEGEAEESEYKRWRE